MKRILIAACLLLSLEAHAQLLRGQSLRLLPQNTSPANCLAGSSCFWSGNATTFGLIMWDTVTADGTIPANALIKPSATTDHRYVIATTADSSQVVVGTTVTAGTSGNTFLATMIYGQERIVLSDGTATITRGQVLSLSTTTDGRVVQGTGNPYCVATASAVAVADTTVTCR